MHEGSTKDERRKSIAGSTLRLFMFPHQEGLIYPAKLVCGVQV